MKAGDRMSLLNAISKLENSIINVEIREPEEIKKIRAKVKSIEDSQYFLQLVRRIHFCSKQFDLNCTAQNEYLVEEARLNFLIEEVKYNGYREILDNPEQIKTIQKRVLEEVDELIKRRKVILDIVSGKQIRLNTII